MRSRARRWPKECPRLTFGRRTYEGFYSVWPHRKDNPFTDVLNNTHKFVASSTLKEPLPWMNSTLLKGNVVQAVTELKEQPGKDIDEMGVGPCIRAGGRSCTYARTDRPSISSSGLTLACGLRRPLMSNVSQSKWSRCDGFWRAG